LAPLPKIALIKKGLVNGQGLVGDTITYTFIVTNVGNIELRNVTVTDALPGIVITGSIATLAVGEEDSTSITGTYIIQSSDVTTLSVTNQATVSGEDPNGTIVTDLSDDSSIFEDDPTVTVLTPPIVVDDQRSYVAGQSKTLNILNNDGQTVPIVPSTLKFTLSGTPSGVLSNDDKTLIVDGEGEWTINNDGTVTFTPEAGFTGDPTPPTYFGLSVDGVESNEARIILQALPPSNEPIPTLSEWALILLMMMLGFVGYRESLARTKRF